MINQKGYYSSNSINNWFITQSIDHPIRTVIFSVIFTLILSSGTQFLSIDDDMMKMLPKNLNSKIIWESLQDEFGSTEVIFVAYGRENFKILNANSLSDLWLFSERLDKLETVKSIKCISKSTKVSNVDGFIEINDLQNKQNLNKNDVKEIESYLNKNPKIKKQLLSLKEDYLITVIQPSTSYSLDNFRDQVVGAAKPLFKNYEVYLGGTAYVTGSLPQLIREDVRILILSGLGIMISILLINLRSLRGVFMVLMLITFSLIAMLGSMGWLYKITNSDRYLFAMLSTSMPIILLTIANSDGVHVVTKFFREMRTDNNVKLALSKSMDALLVPIFLTTLTTISAFLTMTASPLEPLIGYGICVSIGIFWAWFLSTLMLPSVIRLQKWNFNSHAISKASYFERLANQISILFVKSPIKSLLFGLAFIVIGLTGIHKVGIDVNITSFFKKGSDIRESMDFMDDQMTGTMDLRIRVEGDMKDPEVLGEIEKIQDYLIEEKKISLTYSISDVIKQLHQTFMDDNLKYKTIPKEKDKVNNLIMMHSMSSDHETLSSVVNYDYKVGLITALSRVMTTEEIFSFVEKLNIYVKKFIKEKIKIDITGFIIVIRDMAIMIIRSSLLSIFLSLLLVGIISTLFFKNIAWGILSIIPLGTAIILNFGLMGHFDAKLNHITAILSSIIIGVGVDFAIHYISQFRRLSKKKSNINQKVINEVGYPILLDAGSNMGFGALIFSAFIPVQYIGGLMIFAMISTSLGTLIILSSLIELFKNKLIN